MGDKRITIEELDEYLVDHPHKDIIELFMAEAFGYGAEIYVDNNKCFTIIAKVPEMTFTKENGDKIVGIYMSIHGKGFNNNDHVYTWIAVECKSGDIRDGFGIGEYEISDGFKTIVYKAESKAGTCPFCGRDVGVQNLKHVAFADRACKDCYPAAKEKLEFPGWYN